MIYNIYRAVKQAALLAQGIVHQGSREPYSTCEAGASILALVAPDSRASRALLEQSRGYRHRQCEGEGSPGGTGPQQASFQGRNDRSEERRVGKEWRCGVG